MQIRLDLTRHCIATEIKRRHEAAISRYFKTANGRAAGDAELVLLEAALTAFDFGRLRSRWPVLAGGNDLPVTLAAADDGGPCLRFGDTCIVAPAEER